MGKHVITLMVNGESHRLEIEPRAHLADVLRGVHHPR